MAVNETRSMNADLREGLTDGVVKKSTPDRGGVVEPSALYGQLHSGIGHYDTLVSAVAKAEMALRQSSLR